jgi:hypothetical protein
VEAGRGERGQLVSPGVSAVRETVQKQDERPVAELGHVQRHVADVDQTFSRAADRHERIMSRDDSARDPQGRAEGAPA